MLKSKIAFLIPSTSYKRDWKTIKECYLYAYTLKSFQATYDPEHQYTFYIGIDRGDKIYDNRAQQEILKQYLNTVSLLKSQSAGGSIEIKFIYMDNITKGHLTVMWNYLYDLALSEGNDYFYQCGDDIQFQTKGWINACVATMIEHDGNGMTGPVNNNPSILTQSFVSRKHYDKFGYYFPPEIINWFCDNWINDVYRGLKQFYPLKKHLCVNLGGTPRYDVGNDVNAEKNLHEVHRKLKAECDEIVKRDLTKLEI